MNVFLQVILSCFALCASSFAHAFSASESLTETLQPLTHMQAHFVQTIRDVNGQVLQTSEGQMVLLRPGKFRWEVEKPIKQLVVADGQRIWFYDMELHQATIQSQHMQSHAQESPASLLSDGLPDLTRRFQVTALPDTQAGEQVFLLKPRHPELFRTIQLFFADDQITQMVITDNFNQQTTIQFSHINTVSMPDSQLFVVRLPKSVSIIDQT